jgi:ADP-heptose:LPS heptosyltransferase
MIQFVRFATVLKRQGATVIVECQKALLGLFQGCPGIDQLVATGEELPPFDVYAPLISLPGILGTTLETIPAKTPYLFPRPPLVEHWRQRLAGLDGFKIGITWQGSPEYHGDRFRSIPLRYFGRLAQAAGVRLVSLQKGVGVEQLADVRDRFAVVDFTDELDQQSGPFVDTAAVMKSLDLVVTSDTATAHLAGALGVPVWVALPFAADWRWLLDRSDSPWYPTMRLFRQKERGDWQGVFEEIKNALCQRLASPRADSVD